MAHTVHDHISLTSREKELFEMLKAVRDEKTPSTGLRCAGGWVRDKLLGKQSKDIDIALDNLLGEDFGAHLEEYGRDKGTAVGQTAVIRSNPEQSKHLRTACIKVNGFELDLVNLRTETYADGRIPDKIAFGTPQQDAMRRDLTINSLFYNLGRGEEEGSVEDFTGRGLQDLRAGVIRTPLPAQETFLDDPLRVLRAIRFGARFGFELDNELMEAAASTPVSA